MALNAQQQEIKDEFIRLRGGWNAAWDAVLELDPDFMKAYSRFSGVPWRRNRLDALTKEFICIAVNAAATHLYVSGLRAHTRAALRLGATRSQILEVLECTATLGIHAMNVGVPILVQVLKEKGLRDGPTPLTAAQEAMKAEFIKTRGYWHSSWDEILELDPEIFDAYTEYSSVPWRTGTLDPKVREFVHIAFDSAATHLYASGLKLHIGNAIGYGATAEEILEVMEIASTLGMHTVTTAMPILMEEAEALEATKRNGERGAG